jgi:hypothetical protein
VILEKVILKIYPDAKPSQDFFIMDDGNGPEIRNWKYGQPIPSVEELEAAWAEIEAIPPQLSAVEQLQKDQADLMFTLALKGVL